MKCPACGAAASEGAVECPSCGVIFAKLREKLEREKREAQAEVEHHEKLAEGPKLPYIDPRWGRGIAAAIILLWALGFGLYYRAAVRAARERALRSDIRERPTALMRDPVTGEMKAVDVVTTPSKNP